MIHHKKAILISMCILFSLTLLTGCGSNKADQNNETDKSGFEEMIDWLEPHSRSEEDAERAYLDYMCVDLCYVILEICNLTEVENISYDYDDKTNKVTFTLIYENISEDLINNIKEYVATTLPDYVTEVVAKSK